MIDILALAVGIVVVLFAGAIVGAGVGHVGRNPPEPKHKRPSPAELRKYPWPPPYPYKSYQEARDAGALHGNR